MLFNLWLGLSLASLLRKWRGMPVRKSLSISMLVVTLGRIAWWLAHTPPQLPNAMPAWEKAAAKTAHFSLYALLPASTEAARPAQDAHENLGLAMTALVSLHIAAALRHHFLLRDRVPARMRFWAARNG